MLCVRGLHSTEGEQNQTVKMWLKVATFIVSVIALVSRRIQLKLPDLMMIMQSFLRGRPFLPLWLRQSISRAVVLVGFTVLLLAARVKLMGAQLPLFTK